MCEQELDKWHRRVHEAVYQRAVGNKFHSLLLAELWLKLGSCELVGLQATSIKQQSNWFTGE